jgi:hypothetical protein
MRKIQNCLSFVLREYNMAGQSKHFEQLDCLIVDIGEDDLRAALFSDVDDAEENRDSDTVDELGVAEVNNQRAATAIQLPATLTLDLFT